MTDLVPTPKPRLRTGSVQPPNEPECLPECGIGPDPEGLHYPRCPWYEYAPPETPWPKRVPLSYAGDIVGEALVQADGRVECKINPEAAKNHAFLRFDGDLSIAWHSFEPTRAMVIPPVAKRRHHL